jgi:hypothetical protein
MWGSQFLLILDPWGVSFHAAVVFGLGKDFLFKSMSLGHCDQLNRTANSAHLAHIRGKWA